MLQHIMMVDVHDQCVYNIAKSSDVNHRNTSPPLKFAPTLPVLLAIFVMIDKLQKSTKGSQINGKLVVTDQVI